MRILALIFLTLLFLYGNAQYQNVLISNLEDPEEPSICINPRNPNQIVAGSNLNSIYYSQDGGISWTRQTLVSPYGVWGDPCIVVDSSGAFYYLHLSNPPQGEWIDRIVVQKSVDGGSTWNNGSYTYLNDGKQQDKEWATVDFSNNYLYVCWTQFDNYGSTASVDSTLILFARSTDGGQTWDEAKRISQTGGDCIDDDNTVEGAVPAVGPEGQIYAAWSGPLGIMFDRSFDFGQTWLEEDIFVADQPGGWDFAIPGISRCNGMPVTICDTSHSLYRGNVYVNWSDQRNGTNNTDIWISKSTDQGQTWSTPLRVNNDLTTTHQFFTWATIDQTNGNIYVVFYDRRHYADKRTDVYLAISSNGGESFENIKISQTPFTPEEYVFFGDYTNISAHNNMVRPIWARLDNADLSLWTALIQINSSGVPDRTENLFVVEDTYPNPVDDLVHFPFKLRRPDVVSLRVVDLMGQERISVFQNCKMEAGRYVIPIQTSFGNLSPGLYYFDLQTTKGRVVKKFLIE